MFLAWDRTAVVFRGEYSIVLLGSTFVMGMICIGSDVIWLPYMVAFQTVYLPAYFVGAGISGLLPSLMSIVQGSSSYTCKLNSTTNKQEPHFLDPRFSVSTFYFILFLWVCGATLSFYLINNHFDFLNNLRVFSSKPEKDGHSEAIDSAVPNKLEVQMKQTTRCQDAILLICCGLGASQMNTLLPGVQSYASLPYSQVGFWKGHFVGFGGHCGLLQNYFPKTKQLLINTG
jgi:riboflavin transporter 2